MMTKSWYLPETSPGISGRDVSATSQTNASHYSSNYVMKYLVEIQVYMTFTVLFPAIIGSLTVR